MNKNRLTPTLQAALNTQMTKEASAAQYYLPLAAWASDQGYGGIANFLFRHAHEERNHMMKILEYIQERGTGKNRSHTRSPGRSYQCTKLF